MQRFRLMRLYITVVLMLIGVTILVETSRKRTSAAQATRANARVDANAIAMKPAIESTLRRNSGAQQVTVAIDNFKFAQREVSLSVGDTVTWINHDDVPHTATSVDDPATFNSKTLDTDDKYSFTFTKPGTYSYFCKVHPHMTGVIVVK